MLCRARQLLQRYQKRRSHLFQLLFQPGSAIASITSPPLCSILVAAFAAVVRVLHSRQFEIFFPIRTLFLKRRGTVANLYPSRRFVIAEPRVFHVAQVFAFCNGAFAQTPVLDRSE